MKKTEDILLGFVFTNYNSSQETKDAVKSIDSTINKSNYQIVIVDNNSYEDSVQALKQIEKEFDNVHLILHEENVGYFHGLNLGIKYLRDTFKEISYMVIGNNDLIFPTNFYDSILKKLDLFKKYPVLSPDIITKDGFHQNPHVLKNISAPRQLIYDLYYSNYVLAVIIKKIVKYTNPLFGRADNKKWINAQTIKQGHGSCYILGPKFFDIFKELWMPTFLMGEELFLSIQLWRKKMFVFYEPSIMVTHLYHASMSKIPNKKMWKFASKSHKEARKQKKTWSGSVREYQICSNCVMDTTDSKITFDENGVCDHCNDFFKNVKPNWHTDERGRTELAEIMSKIKASGKGKDFDCLLGLSGGVDSSYMLHLAVKEFGLRPLVFHVDGGWNSEVAVHNIQMLVEKLELDLYTEVINWEEMKDFQLAFFKSGVPHIDIPQDHAFVATLYNFADKYNIKYILNGGNISTECVRNPMEWLYYGTDMAQIHDIMKRFSTVEMKTYPFSSIFRHKIYLRYIRGVKVVKMLNYRPYIKAEALALLEKEYGWKPYPQKHFESRFTKFYEGYWLPERFGFDTRRVQYSSLILTKQMTREEALENFKKPAYNPETIEDEFNYIATKLGITNEKLREYFNSEKKFYKDYKNQESMFVLGAKVLKFLGAERSIKR